METIKLIILVFGTPFWIISSALYFGAIEDRMIDFDFLTPTNLYDNTNMNIFGCWLFSILISIASPIAGLVNIVYFITHVGRE